MKTQTLAKKPSLILLLALGLVLSACSDNMLNRKSQTDSGSGTIDYGSRLPVPDYNSKPSDVATCNGAEMNFLKIQAMVYYDFTNQPRNEAIRIWFPQMNSSFQDTTYHINFYKWKANQLGDIYFNPTPLQLRIEKKSDHTNMSNHLDNLNWGKVSDALNYKNIDTTDMNTIFQNYIFTVLLGDNTAEYDVLKVAIYKDSQLLEEKDFLLPAFYAHPLKYAEGKPQVLVNLHPLLSQSNTAWPGSHFTDLLNNFCF